MPVSVAQPALADQSVPFNTVRAGMLMMIVGTMSIPAMDAVAKYLTAAITPLQITWARFLFQFLLMAGLVLLRGSVRDLLPKAPWVHLLRGLLLASATLLFFTGLSQLPLAESIAIFFVQPLILTIFSAVFLKEQVGWHRRIAVLVGFLGALIIIQPGTNNFSIYYLLPLGTAFLFAGYITLTKAYSLADRPDTMQFASGLGATLALSLILGLGWLSNTAALAPQWLNTTQWGLLLVLGVIAAVCHLLVVMATQRAPASVLAPFGYTEFLGATVFGYLVFCELPGFYTWLGVIIIIASGLYTFLREHHLNELAKKPPTETLHQARN